MSMNPEQDDFKQLRRLLALQRYEQPPPRYFNDFSRQVIARIQAGERLEPDSWFERLGWEAPWLQRLLGVLDAKPILAGGFGVAVCGLLLAGIMYSEQGPAPSVATMPVAEPEQPTLARLVDRPIGPLLAPAGVTPDFTASASSADGASLFQQVKAFQRPKVDPTSLRFTPNVGN